VHQLPTFRIHYRSIDGTLQYAAPTLAQQQQQQQHQQPASQYSTYEDVLAEGDATAVRNAIVKRIEGYVGPAMQINSNTAAAQSTAAVASAAPVAAVSSYTDLQQALDDNSNGVTVVAYSALWCRKCRLVYSIVYIYTIL
jgi:hypothetical protein